MPVAPIHRQREPVLVELGAKRGQQRAVLAVDRAHAADLVVVLGDVDQPFPWHPATGGHILQKWHHVVGPFGTTEGDEEHGVIGSHLSIFAVADS